MGIQNTCGKKLKRDVEMNGLPPPLREHLKKYILTGFINLRNLHLSFCLLYTPNKMLT
jgi:hypothetical protein